MHLLTRALIAVVDPIARAFGYKAVPLDPTEAMRLDYDRARAQAARRNRSRTA